jgi:MerR family transcriptional regulator, mercuric resistance operon regulatory protein
MRTSQVAGRAGVNTQTLRYYERRGLLPEPPRSSAGYRDYPVSAVGLLRFVKRAQQLGFPLAEVAGLLELADGGPDSCRRARELAEAQAAALDARIADLKRMRASLGELSATCQRPRSARSCPLMQAIPATGRPGDETADPARTRGPRTALPATPIIQPACDGALPADGTAAKQASLPPRQR